MERAISGIYDDEATEHVRRLFKEAGYGLRLDKEPHDQDGFSASFWPLLGGQSTASGRGRGTTEAEAAGAAWNAYSSRAETRTPEPRRGSFVVIAIIGTFFLALALGLVMVDTLSPTPTNENASPPPEPFYFALVF